MVGALRVFLAGARLASPSALRFRRGTEAAKMQTAWTMAVLATVVGGCSAGGLASEPAQRLDPTKIYLDAFDYIETSRRELDRYRCLSGAPLSCRIVAITAECQCAY